MEDRLTNGLLTVCGLLQKFNVKYLVVGGAAVALHGYYRLSVNKSGEPIEKPDIDIWYSPTYENYFNLLKAIEALGQDVSVFREEQTPNPRKSFFRLAFEAFTLDALPELKASLKFHEAYNRKETVTLDETPIHFISYPDLIADKEALARAKDLLDIEHLRKSKDMDLGQG